MFLRSLSMKGFKSFADPTVLEFEPGITVVVGPNGSGKSNVVDAVTWVLGAQGPRSLRSQKMEDVIFAGTSSRPPLGRAEVSLTIDNSSGRLPVDMAEVTITRTLFRSGDSEYAINGAPCRLLDIQDLLSDSGVGRQQHMIVGQGQLDTILNARPEDRRAIVEEAAGVLKHRRRRERAERRLESTRENLDRLGDLVREVRRQIRPLERQAAATRAHASLTEELLAVRRHLAGAELADLGARHQAVAAELAALSVEERRLHDTLVGLDEASAAAARELSSRREQDLAAALGRVQGLVERSRGAAGVVRERARALAAAIDAAVDVDVVSTLEAEATRLGLELHAAEDEEASLSLEAATIAEAEHRLEADERRAVEEVGEGGDAELEAARRAVADAERRQELLRQSLARTTVSLGSADQRGSALARRKEELDRHAEELAAGVDVARAEGVRLAAAAEAAQRWAARAATAAAEAEQAATDAERARHRGAARAEALARALHELLGAGSHELLADVDGVVGSLLDLVDIDPGWEAAFEAAAGAAVTSVVVRGHVAARSALARLRERGATGVVLAPGPGGLAQGALPEGSEAVRPHVRPRSARDLLEVDRVLDALVGCAVRVASWHGAIDVSLARPELVVVTPEGDRFAASGWRVRSRRSVVTAAAVEQARAEAEEAARHADEASTAFRRARDDGEQARQEAARAARDLDRHESAVAALEAERSRLDEERARVAAELGDVEGARRELAERAAADRSSLADVERSLPELEARLGAARQRAEAALGVRRTLEERRARLAADRHDLGVRAAGLAERRRVLAGRLAEVERRLAGHAEERRQAALRRSRLEAGARALGWLGAVVEGQRARLEAVLAALQGEYRTQVDAARAGGERLREIQAERTATEQRLAGVRERTGSLQLQAAELALRMEALEDMVRRELGTEPRELARVPAPELPEGTSAEEHARRLRDRLGELGPVNPLALEELSELEERHRELERQVDDVRSARRQLQEVVRSLDEEIVRSFASAAADVNEHFSSLVATLFPGGTGRLVLTEPDDLLHTGIEVEVRPAGRNVRRVSLLSGGERSLAALAFLFAVFRSRPSPFYLMDEVEAALDDVNLHRFLGLVREFREEAQLIIVSHQKRTMETGDALYGVTMAPGGSSQVVSQRFDRRPQLAAP